MNRSQPGKRAVSALATLGAAVLAIAFTGQSAQAETLPSLDGLDKVTSLVQGVPLADAVPSNVAKVPDAKPGKVVMEDNSEKDGDEVEYNAGPVNVERDGTRYSALPLTPDALQGLPTESLPLAEAVPGQGLSEDQLGKVNWVLDQAGGGLPTGSGTPGVDSLGDLQETLGDTAQISAGPLTPEDVTAATQAAMWHYTTGKKLAPKKNPENVVALYRYFTGPANVGLPVGPHTQAPRINAPTTPVTPSTGELTPELQGMASDLFGPLSLENAESADVIVSQAAESVSIVDGAGVPVKKMRAGTKYYLHMPVNGDPGQAVMTVVGAPQNAAGTVLTTVDNPQQALVLTDPAQTITRRNSSAVTWGTRNLVTDAIVGVVCNAEGLGMAIDNSKGSKDSKVSVAGTPVEVPAGTTQFVPLNIAEGEKYDVDVVKDGKSAKFAGTRFCGDRSAAADRKAPQAAGEGGGNKALALTGSTVTTVAIAGGVLVIAGAALFLTARRRKAHQG